MSVANIIRSSEQALVRPIRMHSGQIGFIRNNGSYNNRLVMKFFRGLMDLNSPRITWDENAEFDIELLPVGSQVVLKVDE